MLGQDSSGYVSLGRVRKGCQVISMYVRLGQFKTGYILGKFMSG